jgi:uncharacterized caspase-like protein
MKTSSECTVSTRTTGYSSFSGHGHTREKGAKGYLVPADAPNPNKDRVGFLRKALPMNQILAWSRQVEAKHALFLFDSCFSGTVFKAKDLPQQPPHISRATALPVRQYITAGEPERRYPPLVPTLPRGNA